MRADVAHYILVASLLTSGKFRFEIEDLEKKKTFSNLTNFYHKSRVTSSNIFFRRIRMQVSLYISNFSYMVFFNAVHVSHNCTDFSLKFNRTNPLGEYYRYLAQNSHSWTRLFVAIYSLDPIYRLSSILHVGFASHREAIGRIGRRMGERIRGYEERKPSRFDRVSPEVRFTVVHTGLAHDEDGHTRFLPL